VREDVATLRYEADAGAGTLVSAHLRDIVAIDIDMPAAHRLLAHDRLHQRRLADTVAPKHGGRLAGPHVQRNIPEHLSLAISGADAAEVEQVGHFARPR
jgi:hypothetical protein